ncbi:MAG: carboxylating.nicotinate-nucleotide diphosphorylase, partial [Promethearchaeota archaeon]
IVSFSKKIEIEVEKIEEVLIAAKNGADIIMLDNMSPDQVADAIKLLKEHNLRDQVIIEVSGGITQNNIVDYLLSVPDVISTSELTQFPSERIDFSLRFD